MAKYRLLTREELSEFKKEFIDYLVVNGLTAEDWEKIKIDSPEKANKMLELFSDVVFEGVLRKVTFLDFKSKSSIKSFQCLEDKIVLVGIDTNNESLNLLDVKEVSSFVEKPPKGLSVYTSEKQYSKGREKELFSMISSGCEIADGSLFKSLCLALT